MSSCRACVQSTCVSKTNRLSHGQGVGVYSSMNGRRGGTRMPLVRSYLRLPKAGSHCNPVRSGCCLHIKNRSDLSLVRPFIKLFRHFMLITQGCDDWELCDHSGPWGKILPHTPCATTQVCAVHGRNLHGRTYGYLSLKVLLRLQAPHITRAQTRHSFGKIARWIYLRNAHTHTPKPKCGEIKCGEIRTTNTLIIPPSSCAMCQRVVVLACRCPLVLVE